MDLNKIGMFIAKKRKEKGLTQLELAEKLNITDRAVSKWECSRSVPDSFIMLKLCEILDISVNELLLGEEIKMNDYNKQTEMNLIEMIKQKEEADKRLLKMEIVIGIFGTIFLFSFVLIAALINMLVWVRILLIVSGFIIFLVACIFAIRIEQVAGYYECKYCHFKYTPTYNQVIGAFHFGRTRYMKCPKCGKRSYQKKVISNNELNV